MRFVLTNFGTTGDFRPLLTLGRELAARGDELLFAFPPYAEPLMAASGFRFYPLGPDLKELRDRVNRGWSETLGIYDSFEQMSLLLDPFNGAFDQVLGELKAICQDADALISGPAQPVAKIVHELTGIPFISVQLSHFGGNGGPGLKQAGEQLVNGFRRRVGLAPISEPFTRGANSSQLALYAMSAVLRPRPSDWPSHYHLTGFFFEQPDREWRPDERLQRFMARGEVVAVTLGSMVHSNTGRLIEVLLEALRLTGCRAVVQGIPTEHVPSDGPDYVHWVDTIPHGWLFPRSSCIVLHGGSGTAAATFRAGVPGIYIPHGDCFDQRYWAQIAEEAGCSMPSIQYAELTAPKLANALSQSRSDRNLRVCAQDVAHAINREPGVSRAALLVRSFVQSAGLCSESLVGA